jgi:hypothetical protein
MSTVDDTIARLRAELAGLGEPARTAPLIRLGQALVARVIQNGPSAPSALPDIDAAVTALDEALGNLREDDPVRGAVSCILGLAHCWRGNFVNDPENRDAAVHHLSTALASGSLSVTHVVMAQMALGSQYVFRATSPLMSSGATMNLIGAMGNSDLAADCDRAADCFSAVLAGKSVSAEIRDLAQTLLELVSAFRPILGGGQGGLSLEKMANAMVSLQAVQERVTRDAKPGYGGFGLPDVFTFDITRSILSRDPLENPVAVFEGEFEEKQPLPAPESVVPEQVDLRQSLRERLSLTDAGVPVWEAAAMLLSGVATPAVAVVDEAVALASTVVEEDGDVEPADAAVDWFLLAVTLHLRDRVDSGGTDRQAGADALLTAARKVPADHPAAVVIMCSLGAFLDPENPLGGVLDRVAAGFAGRLDAVLAGGSVSDQGERANLHALRCVCRAAWAVGELDRALDHVQPDYPWPDPLKAARSAR